MESKQWVNLTIRVVVALGVGFVLWECALSGTRDVSALGSFFGMAILILYALVLFALFGWPLILHVGERLGNGLFMPSDANFRVVPEYSLAESKVKKGRYAEAVDEYRKVIAKYPEDIYPHLRIAELAVNHLSDLKLAELELLSALGKANGEDSTALAAGRLADLYQNTLKTPARALEVMKQLREKIPGTKQAKLAEERIAVLEDIVLRGLEPARAPDKIANRPSRYKM